MASIPDAWLVVPALAVDEDESRSGDRDRDAPSNTRAGDATEAALLASALRGQEAALQALYTAHAPAILRFLGDLLGDRAAAADGTQETFVRAFRRLDTLRDRERVLPWLFGIARNVSLEQRKARRRRGRFLVADRGDDDPTPEAADPRTPEAELLGREAARIIEAALSRLSDDRRAMLLLRLDHGLAYDEIAALMGFSLAKVKVEIHRARQLLRAELDAYGGDRP